MAFSLGGGYCSAVLYDETNHQKLLLAKYEERHRILGKDMPSVSEVQGPAPHKNPNRHLQSTRCEGGGGV
jgi:hypothetical protein